MELSTSNTALLVMDMQEGILAMFPQTGASKENISKAIAMARKRQLPVIYVTVGFRKGAPEANLSNKSFGAAKDKYAKMNMEEFMKIPSDLAPVAYDITVIKRRVSAFTGSDLEVVLRSFGIQHIILSGISTSGVVLSTVREAADKDYRITVLSDCCADADEEVHRVLTTKVFPRQADVLSLDAWSKI